MQYVLFTGDQPKPFTKWPEGSQVQICPNGYREWSDRISREGSLLAGLSVDIPIYGSDFIARVPRDNVIVPMDLVNMEGGRTGFVIESDESSGYGVIYLDKHRDELHDWEELVFEGDNMFVGSIERVKVVSVVRKHPIETINNSGGPEQTIYGRSTKQTVIIGGNRKISCELVNGEPVIKYGEYTATYRQVLDVIEGMQTFGVSDAPTLEELDVVETGCKDLFSILVQRGGGLFAVNYRSNCTGWDVLNQSSMTVGGLKIVRVRRYKDITVAWHWHNVSRKEDSDHPLKQPVIWEDKKLPMFGDYEVNVKSNDRFDVGCSAFTMKDAIAIRDAMESIVL